MNEIEALLGLAKIDPTKKSHLISGQFVILEIALRRHLPESREREQALLSLRDAKLFSLDAIRLRENDEKPPVSPTDC